MTSLCVCVRAHAQALISLMISEVERFILLPVGHIYVFFGQMSILYLFNGLNSFSAIVGVPYKFWSLTFIRYMVCKYFLSFRRLSFHSVSLLTLEYWSSQDSIFGPLISMLTHLTLNDLIFAQVFI